jgi:hypothetical protein
MFRFSTDDCTRLNISHPDAYMDKISLVLHILFLWGVSLVIMHIFQ